MVENMIASEINLYDLQTKFGLEYSDDPQFFREWQSELPELTDEEKHYLDEIKADYLHLSKYTVQEPIVKMVILSPLLKLAGFYRPPFYLAAEKIVTITAQDGNTIVKGRLDLLVFTPQFWIMVVESKRTQFSLEAGIPQALTYMLGSPDTQPSSFGMVTNGAEFMFLKLHKYDLPKYARSRPFATYFDQDIYTVLSIIKKIKQIALNS